jgi:ubiquinone/menaquinone biosynthesis C-methylase UbiE
MRLPSIDYLCCPACNGTFDLDIKKQLEAEVVQGILECRECKRCFNITEGLPNLNFPKNLEASDLSAQMYHDQNAQSYDRDNRWALFCLGIWEFALMEDRCRKSVINKLELKKDATVLETGVGTGSNLQVIAKQIGGGGQLYGSDISSEIVKVARRKMEAKVIRAEFTQANASYLPYRTGTFDAVLQIGGMNQFGDKKRAIEEMHRVAVPGAKIVICDEGLASGKEKTWMGRRILKRDPEGLFTTKPPIELLPDKIKDLKVSWIWHDFFWVVEFRKTE